MLARHIPMVQVIVLIYSILNKGWIRMVQDKIMFCLLAGNNIRHNYHSALHGSCLWTAGLRQYLRGLAGIPSL